MLKTKKKFLLIALLSAIAMLCCGMALLFAPTSASVTTNTNMTVKADVWTQDAVTAANTQALSDYQNYMDEEWSYDYPLVDTDNQGLVYQYDYENDYGYYVVGYTSNLASNITIPDSLHEQWVCGLAENALRGSSVETIVLSSSVSYVKNGAISNCSNLKSITVESEIEWGNNNGSSDAVLYVDGSYYAQIVESNWAKVYITQGTEGDLLYVVDSSVTFLNGEYDQDNPEGFDLYDSDLSNAVCVDLNNVEQILYTGNWRGVYGKNVYLRKAFEKLGGDDGYAIDTENLYADSWNAIWNTHYGPDSGGCDLINAENVYVKNALTNEYEKVTNLTLTGDLSTATGAMNLDSITSVTLNNLTVPNSYTNDIENYRVNCSYHITSVTLSGTSYLVDWFSYADTLETINIGEGCAFIKIDASRSYYYSGLESINITATTIPTLVSGSTIDVPVYVPAGMKSAYVSAWESVQANIGDYIVEEPTYETQNNIKYQLFSDNNTAVIIEAEEGFNASELVIGTIEVGEVGEEVTYTVVGIEANAFNGKSTLRNVTIPASVTSIGENAFANTGLTDVTFQGTSVPTGVNNLPNTVQTINVPTAQIEAYKSALGALATKVAEPPETGIALDIILPSVVIGLVAVATVFVWKRKEQY